MRAIVPIALVVVATACSEDSPRSYADDYVEKIRDGDIADAQEMHCEGRPIEIQDFRSPLEVDGVSGDEERSCIEGSIDIDGVGQGTSIAIDVFERDGRRCIFGVRVLGVCDYAPTPPG